MKKVTILIPAYNEAASLPALLEAVGALRRDIAAKHPDIAIELLAVNDGSSDDTREVLDELSGRYPFLSYINLSRNFGKEAALLAGMDAFDGECLIMMDADLQHPVSVIPQMIDSWLEGYDDVYGRRLDRGKESWVRKKISATYYTLLQKTTPFDIMPNVGDFRLLDRRCVAALRSMRETQRNTKALSAWIGFRKKGVGYTTADRANGRSRYSVSKLFNLAITGFTGFTTAPLRIASIAGVVVSLFAFIYLVVTLFKTLFWGEAVKGYPSLMIVILFLGGIQLLMIGLLGEYIATILNEVKQRPPYIIADSHKAEIL